MIPSSAEGYLVNDEVWETETYRQLFGKWSSPIAKPRFSNVGGADKLSDGPNETFPVLEPPDGWDVVDGEWVLWPGTMSLTSDRDGWMYGKGYPDIVKQVQQGEDSGSSDEVRRGATVRRRRWIRTRRCVTPKAQDVVRAELVWLRSIVESLKVSMRSKREDHLVLAAFEEQRARAYKEARTASAHRVIAFKDVLVKYQDNLATMKVIQSRCILYSCTRVHTAC